MRLMLSRPWIWIGPIIVAIGVMIALTVRVERVQEAPEEVKVPEMMVCH